MKAKVVYCRNRFGNSTFASIRIPIVFSKNLIVGGSGILYKGNIDLYTPRSYILGFIRLTSKFIGRATILNIIEEQLKNGSKLGISRLEIRSSTIQSEYERLNTIYICAEDDIDLDDSRVFELIEKYVLEREF
jgi:hypothetical protein